MKRAPLKEREKALLAFAATFLPAVFVFLFGALSQRSELARKSAEREKLEVAVGQRPGTSDPDLAKLVARRAALRDEIEKTRKACADLERVFAPRTAPALGAVSELAARLGVTVRESAPVAAPNDPLPRPRRRFVVVASFAALRAFVAALPALRDGPVHLESLSVDSATIPTSEGDASGDELHVLVATLVLVL